MKQSIKMYNIVKIGKKPKIEDYVVLGKSAQNITINQSELIIGDFPTIRTGTIIYTANIIGNNFTTGDHTRIRENNVIGDNVSIGTNTVIECNCEIKDHVRIHSNCFIPEHTTIGEEVWIGPCVTITNVLHPPCPIFKKFAPIKGGKCCVGPIIKKGAVIGAGSVILPGIVIGEDVLIGAGTVVTCNISNGYVAFGNPAKIVRKIEDLDCPLGYYKKGEVYSWRKK
jgi:acetyltransferase-like isoleucine patch superfamily enzyme